MATTLTLNVESSETICSVKRRLGDKEGIHSDVVQMLIYEGKHLHDSHSLAHYNILQDSTLHLLTRKRQPHIYVKTVITRKIITLPIVGLNTIDDVKAKIHEHEGIPPKEQCLYFATRKLAGNQTLLENHIGMESNLYLVLQFRGSVSQSSPSELAQRNVTSQGWYKRVASQQTKRGRPQTINAWLAAQAKRAQPPPQTKKVEPAAQTTPTKATHSIFDPQPMSADNTYDAKLNIVALHQPKATAGLTDVMPEIQSRPPSSVLTELEDLKREMVTAHSKEKELEANISRLTLENKVVSAQCASYESQVVGLEAEYKKTKEEIMVSDKKLYSGARATGYAEGLREGKTKWLKSVEFLRHLTDASMQYFDYGFESCQKQAEHQGFVGQLNKDSALKEAPLLKDGNMVPKQSKCPLKMADPGRNI